MPDTADTVSRETGEVVSRETALATIDVHPAVMPYNGETYEQLQASADVKFGAELEKGNLLIGVPFVALRLTYRPGAFLNPVTNTTGHYVSIDLMVGDEKEIARGKRRGRINESFDLEPGEILVINEGGTGVYRQTVEYLADTKGWITLPDGPRNGAYGESRYDTPVEDWRYPDRTPVRMEYTAEGEATATVDIRLECPRGLRISEYENEYTKSGVTRYIA